MGQIWQGSLRLLSLENSSWEVIRFQVSIKSNHAILNKSYFNNNNYVLLCYSYLLCVTDLIHKAVKIMSFFIAAITYHGLLSDVHMWGSASLDIKRLSCRNDNQIYLDILLATWNIDNVTVVSANSSQYSLRSYPSLQSSITTDSIDNISLPQCVPPTTTIRPSTSKDIEPVVVAKTHQPEEAAGAEVFGTTGLIVLAIIAVLIVISDIRYFERVLPIFRRNFMVGMRRIKEAIYRPNIVGGMQQLIVITANLGRDRPPQTDQTTPRNSQRRKISKNVFTNFVLEMEQRKRDDKPLISTRGHSSELSTCEEAI